MMRRGFPAWPRLFRSIPAGIGKSPDGFHGSADRSDGSPDSFHGSADRNNRSPDGRHGSADRSNGSPDSFHGSADRNNRSPDGFRRSPWEGKRWRDLPCGCRRGNRRRRTKVPGTGGKNLPMPGVGMCRTLPPRAGERDGVRGGGVRDGRAWTRRWPSSPRRPCGRILSRRSSRSGSRSRCRR